MVFCAAESLNPAAWKPVDVAFPHHAELKCNQEEMKQNLKGLKNKPGSTRPVDVTHLLRKKAGFPNSIELVYALTTKVCFDSLVLFAFLLSCCTRSHDRILCAYRLHHQSRNSFSLSILFNGNPSTR